MELFFKVDNAFLETARLSSAGFQGKVKFIYALWIILLDYSKTTNLRKKLAFYVI